MITITKVMVGFIILTFSACVEVETFVNVEENDTFEPINRVNLLNNSDIKLIDNKIKDDTHFDAVVALKGKDVFYDYGEKDIPFNCASVRKSIFSALYGIAQDKGLIDLDATLKDLGIDDEKKPLTETEKSATINDLLTARSGIYIPAAGESKGMKDRRPERGQFLPGEHFYYNNWDFNILPIILEDITGMTIGELIYEWLAIPTGMKVFSPDDVTYQYVDYTEYPQTRVYMSAEDLARIGSLYLNEGKWGDKQVIPASWVENSVKSVSTQPEDTDLLDNELMEGYAYLWWIDEDENTVWADGSGGQFLVIDKERNLAVVLRNNTGMSSASFLIYSSTDRFEPNTDGNIIYKTIRSKVQ